MSPLRSLPDVSLAVDQTLFGSLKIAARGCGEGNDGHPGRLFDKRQPAFPCNVCSVQGRSLRHCTLFFPEKGLTSLSSSNLHLCTISDQVKNYKEVKDLYILGDTSDVVANLDDSLVTINTVLSSRYVGGIRGMVDEWRGKLVTLQVRCCAFVRCDQFSFTLGFLFFFQMFNYDSIMVQDKL